MQFQDRIFEVCRGIAKFLAHFFAGEVIGVIGHHGLDFLGGQV